MFQKLISHCAHVAVSLILISCAQKSMEKSYGNDGEIKKIPQTEAFWLLDRYQKQKPRGGTTIGVQPKIDKTPKNSFLRIAETSSKKQKDRLAILSMVGEYRATFEFTEVFGGILNYELDRPYQSWGTEIVYPVVEDENFISLQHILVMYIKDKNGETQGPYVQKHWRQDWKFQDTTIMDHPKYKTWTFENISKKEAKGTWAQKVFQVDDSPRYESYGKWIHEKGASRWISHTTRRPVPRREHTIRKDYDHLKGINKITILSWGWVMEEINDKIQSPNQYIGTEYGVARYQSIKGYNFKPAYEYWQETATYWKAVAQSWESKFSKKKKICLRKSVEKMPLFMFHFMEAGEYAKATVKDKKLLLKKPLQTINRFIKNCD